MNFNTHFLCPLLLLVASSLYAQEPGYFNHGRTRCFGGGMSFSQDGKTLFHVEMIKMDSLQPARLQVVKSTWREGKWSTPASLNLFDIGHEVSPVLTPDGNRLYFASTSPVPGKAEPGDLNICYVDRTTNGWSKPVFAEALNSSMADRITHIDKSGNYYIVSNKNGSQDIYIASLNGSNWTAPVPMSAWNSDLEEEYVSVHEDIGIAFIQRSRPGQTTEILYSIRASGQWSTPVGLDYDGEFNEAPYVQRAPMLSPDGGTFYLIAQGLIWQQATAALFTKNKIELKVPECKFLPVPDPAAHEPQPFGGLSMKTNNGISFTPDMKTIYVSRYTSERDSAGRQFIKIFESTLINGQWSRFKQLDFCKPGVPFEYHPVLSQDGRRLFFNSRAPEPGSTAKYITKNNPWYVDKIDDRWKEPVLLSSLTTDAYDDYVSPVANGNLYFRSDRGGGKGQGDIYISKFVNGKNENPTIIESLSSVDNENDVCIDPAERFIIFNRYFDNTKEISLFVSIRKGNEWTAPRKLQLNSSSDWELTPTLSPDGKYFFYEVNSNIFRVETKTLFTAEELKLLKHPGD